MNNTHPKPVSLLNGNLLLVFITMIAFFIFLYMSNFSQLTGFTVANETFEETTILSAAANITNLVPTNTTTANVTIQANETNETTETVSTISAGDVVIEETLEQSPVVLGQSVKWVKKIKASGKVDGVIVNLPAEADKIEVTRVNADERATISKTKIRERREKQPVAGTTLLSGAATVSGANILERLKGFFGFLKSTITGASTVSVDGAPEEGNITLEIEEELEEVEIEYETPGPQAFEEKLETGKRVTISSNLDYTNILAFTEVPEAPIQNVELFHIVGGERVGAEITDFTDEDADGLKDTVYWIVPHLSNQTYELDLIILNPLETVAVGNDWVVYFNTTGTAKLNITKDEEAFHVLQYNSLHCGDQIVNPLIQNESVVVYNWSCNDQTASINHTKVNESEYFTQKFEFGEGDDAIVKIAEEPNVTFYNESSGESSTTSTTFQTKTTKTINVNESGEFLILATAQLHGRRTWFSVKTRLQLDSSTISKTVWESKDASKSRDYQTYVTHKIVNLSNGTHTVDLQWATEHPANRAFIRDARISIINLEDVEFVEAEAEQSLSTSNTDVATLTFTPTFGNNYLILATGEYKAGSTSKTTFVDLTIDSVLKDEARYEAKDTTDYKPFAFHNVSFFNALSHTVKVRAKEESSTSAKIRRVRIAAIPLTEDFDFYARESNEESLTSLKTYQTKTTLTFTPNQTGDYLFFATAELDSDETSVPVGAVLEIDGEIACEHIQEPKEADDPKDFMTFACSKNLTLSNTTIHEAKIKFKKVAGNTGTDLCLPGGDDEDDDDDHDEDDEWDSITGAVVGITGAHGGGHDDDDDDDEDVACVSIRNARITAFKLGEGTPGIAVIDASAKDALGTPINVTFLLKQNNNVVYNKTNKTFFLTVPVGTYDVSVAPVEQNVLSRTELVSLELFGVKVAPGFALPRIDYPNESIQRFSDGVQPTAFDTGSLDFEFATAKFRSTGGIVYKCPNWNLTTRDCGTGCTYADEEAGLCEINGTWEPVSFTSPEDIISFNFTPGDPAFSAYSEESGESSTTSTSFVNKTVSIFVPENAGKHLITATAQLHINSFSQSVLARLLVDGIVVSNTIWEPTAIAIGTDYQAYGTHVIQDLDTTTHTIELQWSSESGATAFIKNARINVVEVPNPVNATNEASNPLGTSFVGYTNLTFTPNATDEYLVLASGEIQTGSCTQSSTAQLTLNGADIDNSSYECKDTTDYKPFFFHSVKSLTSGAEQNLTLNAKRTGTAGGEIRRARISAIQMTDDFDVHHAANDTVGISSCGGFCLSPLTNKTILSFTPNETADYLFLATAQFNNDGGFLETSRVVLTVDGENVCDVRQRGRANANPDQLVFVCQVNRTLETSPHTATISYQAFGFSPSTTIKNARITAIKITPPPTPPKTQLRQIIKGRGTTSGATTVINFTAGTGGLSLLDTSKAFHVISYRHTFAEDHADTFKSSEITSLDQLTIYGDSSGGSNPINFEYSIFEFTDDSSINVQRDVLAHSPGETFPITGSFADVGNLSQAFLLNQGHDHNAGETTIGCEEYDRVRLLNTTSWELDVGCAPNSGTFPVQNNRVEVVDWNDPTFISNTQRGLATLSVGSDSVSIAPPTPVAHNRTLLFVSAYADSGFTWDPDEIGLFATLNESGQINIQRDGTTAPDDIFIAWELVEFLPGTARVQHVSINVSGGTNAETATILPVTFENATAFGTVSVPFGHGAGKTASGAGGAIDRIQYTVRLMDSSTVNVTRGDSTGDSMIGVQIIDFKPAEVKSIAIGLSNTLAGGINWFINNLTKTDDWNATGNNDSGTTEYYVAIQTENTDADSYILSSGALQRSAGIENISQPNQKVANSTFDPTISGAPKSSLTTNFSDNPIGFSLPNGSTVYLKFFLNVSGGTGAGSYLNNVTIKAVEEGQTP